ncbi:MAG: hypothetical protein HYX99_02815 [Chloroflexi bacterium]|nr:hypothetical protein [Chloroflexota bacterium]
MVRVKALATRAGLSSVAAEDGKIVLRSRDKLQVPGPIRAPGVSVGTTQVRLDLGRLGDGWQAALEQVLVALSPPG